MSYRRRKKKGRNRKMSQEQRGFKKRAGWKNKHHDKAKSLGGSYANSNIIYLDERRHSALHLCFGLRTMFQIAEVCLRMHNMKNETKYIIMDSSMIM